MSYRGDSLRHLREERQIPLRSISDQTRINLCYLSAIEEEQFDRFPGAFYFKSFTREYARALGLDPSEVLRDMEPAYREWSLGREERRPPVRPIPPYVRFMARFRGWGTS